MHQVFDFEEMRHWLDHLRDVDEEGLPTNMVREIGRCAHTRKLRISCTPSFPTLTHALLPLLPPPPSPLGYSQVRTHWDRRKIKARYAERNGEHFFDWDLEMYEYDDATGDWTRLRHACQLTYKPTLVWP